MKDQREQRANHQRADEAGERLRRRRDRLPGRAVDAAVNRKQPTFLAEVASARRATMSRVTAPLLVFAVGSTLRGDDALGPALAEELPARLDAALRACVELRVAHQLLPEHAAELTGRRHVLFVDASVRATIPFELRPLEAAAAAQPPSGSHRLVPASLLALHAALYGPPPPASLLALHAERFDPGAPLSPAARAHLDRALAFLPAHLASLLEGAAACP